MQSSCVKAPFASHFIADCEYPISDIHHTLYRDASSGRGHRIGSSGRFRYFYYERCFFIYDPYQRDHGSRHSQGPCISDDAAYSDEYGDRGFLGRVGFLLYAAALHYRHSRILLSCLYSFCGRGAAWYVHNVCSCVDFRVLKV